MREIKFRTYTDRYGMEYIDDLYWFEENSVHKSSEHIFMQYTGLKDKNKKEIYEGDILKKVHIPKNGKTWTELTEVKFYICVDDFDGIYAGYNIICDSEIIGNKYENPELLEKR